MMTVSSSGLRRVPISTVGDTCLTVQVLMFMAVAPSPLGSNGVTRTNFISLDFSLQAMPFLLE